MKMTILRELWIWMKDAVWFLRISRPGVRVPSIAPNHENPNLFSIGEGFGFFVFFGKQNEGSFPTAVCPKPYQKNRITKVTTVKVP
jgi:hypothetical protein